MPPTRRGGRQRAGTRSTSAKYPVTTTATRPFGFVSATTYSAVLVFALLAWASQGAFSIPIKSSTAAAAAAAAIATPTTAAAPTARKASPVTASSYASSASRLFASAPSGDSGGDGSTTPPGSSGASRSADGGVRPSRVVPSRSQQLPRPPGDGGSSNGVNASTNSRNDGPDNYHLLWSPRFWKKTAATTGALFLGRYLLLSSAPTAAIVDGACRHAAAAAAVSAATATATATTAATTATAAAATGSSSHRLLLGPAFRNLVLPMFASACCLLQLILNALVGGCAGFNKYLGPTRPYMLSLLLFLTLTGGVPTTTTTTTTTVMTSTPPPLRTILTTHAWRWGLALLPEALHLWNAQIGRYRKSRILKEQQQEVDLEESITKHDITLDADTVHHLGADGTKQVKDKEDFLVTTTAVVEATVQIHIPTMGCVACINNIDSSLWNAGKGWMPHKGAEQEQSTVSSTTAVRIREAASALYHPLTDGPDKKGGYAMIKFDLITTKAKTNPDTNKPEAPSSSSSSSSSSSMKDSNDTGISVNDVVDTLVQAIDKAGFGDGCTVESVTVRNK